MPLPKGFSDEISGLKGKSGPKPKCLCGICETCKNRERVRLYRDRRRAVTKVYGSIEASTVSMEDIENWEP